MASPVQPGSLKKQQRALNCAVNPPKSGLFGGPHQALECGLLYCSAENIKAYGPFGNPLRDALIKVHD